MNVAPKNKNPQMTSADSRQLFTLVVSHDIYKSPRKTRQRSVICHNFYCNVAIFVRVGGFELKTMFHLRLFYTEIAIMTDIQNIFSVARLTW